MESSYTEYEQITVIVNFGQGSKVLKFAHQNGVPGGAIFLGMGTMKSKILEFLELTDIRKEIVIMAAEKATAEAALERIDKEFELKKPYHGIAFTTPLSVLLGSKNRDYQYKAFGGSAMYNLITAVVDKGQAELVMDIATAAGARGGTIMKARGAGVHESTKLFQMDIEPEREIIMILSELGNVEKIATAIRDQLGLGKDTRGVVFCQEVVRAYGVS